MPRHLNQRKTWTSWRNVLTELHLIARTSLDTSQPLEQLGVARRVAIAVNMTAVRRATNDAVKVQFQYSSEGASLARNYRTGSYKMIDLITCGESAVADQAESPVRKYMIFNEFTMQVDSRQMLIYMTNAVRLYFVVRAVLCGFALSAP